MSIDTSIIKLWVTHWKFRQSGNIFFALTSTLRFIFAIVLRIKFKHRLLVVSDILGLGLMLYIFIELTGFISLPYQIKIE